ncbi:hypothetical protein LOZ53_005204 [Ophidiomyces ophidiicola]|nr:hypothetical protein LOZ55_000630 [Ophidiomyces ophidiicola]KAI1984233.1 hypothetical protein LOZ54_004609 [Ophidiomyces ophidiicola]KAI1985056.1 hypothetical protein LOZ53_005204 [Ophidiomyces ophidiicola]KAI1998678.1 hypothetical protein LOZ51_002412 [Ophidiomyces ophidiicola]
MPNNESWVGHLTRGLVSLFCKVLPGVGDCLLVDCVREIELKCSEDTDQGAVPQAPPKVYTFLAPPSFQSELPPDHPPSFFLSSKDLPTEHGTTGDLSFGLRQAKSSEYELPVDGISTEDAPPTPPPSPESQFGWDQSPKPSQRTFLPNFRR